MWDWLFYDVMKVGSRAAGNCESGQDRKIAALSRIPRVTWGFLAGAYEFG